MPASLAGQRPDTTPGLIDAIGGLLREGAAMVSQASAVLAQTAAMMAHAGPLIVAAEASRSRPARPVQAPTQPVQAPPPPRPEAAPAPPDGQLPGLRADQWCTPARKAVLQRGWPGGDDVGDLAAEMGRLPGIPVPSYTLIASKAASIGLHRTPAYLAAMNARVAGRFARTDEGRAYATMRTQAREAILRADWPANVSWQEIATKMRALPGGDLGVPPVDHNRIRRWATELRLRRPTVPRPVAGAAAGPVIVAADPVPQDAPPVPVPAEVVAPVPVPGPAESPQEVPPDAPAPVESQDVAPSAPPVAARPRLGLARWSYERVMLLRSTYPTAASVDEVVTALNRLPGPALQRREVQTFAVMAGVPQPPAPVLVEAHEVTWADCQRIAAALGIAFNGDMHRLNRARENLGQAPVVLVEPLGPGSSPHAAASEQAAD